MPRLTVYGIRAALVHLAVGFTFGGLLQANKALSFEPALWGLLPAHIEMLTLGWMAQLAIAVAYWILPRFAGQRGNVPLAWASVIGLNLGVILTGVGPVLQLAPYVPLIGRVLSAGAILAFALHAWPRIRPARA